MKAYCNLLLILFLDSSDLFITLGTNFSFLCLIAGKEMRTSVSSEVYGHFHKKEKFVPKVINKSEESKNRIKSKLQ
jgi:hypothetical protein